MDCNVSGNPEPQLSWFKDGVEINSSSSSQVRILRGGRVMQIPSPGVEDSGLYTCKTTSVAGQAEKVYRLQVLGENSQYIHLLVATKFLEVNIDARL